MGLEVLSGLLYMRAEQAYFVGAIERPRMEIRHEEEETVRYNFAGCAPYLRSR
jgi:hypothetical protein